MSSSFAQLKELYNEPDEFDEIAKSFEKEQREESTELEKVVQANQYGNGFAPEVSEAPGQYEPLKLNARHKEILRLSALGYKNVQIAAMLSITPVNVSYVLNSPLGRTFMAEIQDARTDSVKDVHTRLQEMSPFAAEVMLDIMSEGKSESNRLKAAETVLKITGHSGEQKHLHLHQQLSQDEILRIKEEVKNGPQVVSEAEVIEEEPNDES